MALHNILSQLASIELIRLPRAHTKHQLALQVGNMTIVIQTAESHVEGCRMQSELGGG